MTPTLSICVPNLNARPFLQERFDSIFVQTLKDWELFVYDSFSDDGSWEFIQDLAANDSRIRIGQGPRQGVYPAWNECIRQTNGEYVYIATSDDSMAPDFLEKMVAALEAHRDCELAYSPLVITNENGGEVNGLAWPECTAFADGSREFINIPHVRYAPYDGLLQLSGRHTVLSITQLLMRRSIFERVGNFSDRWGSPSDFYWEMKAGLVANTIYVPDTWSTWRIHQNQATNETRASSLEEYSEKVGEMIRCAVAECERSLPEAVRLQLQSHLVDHAEQLRAYYLALRQRRDHRVGRVIFQLGQLLAAPTAVRREIFRRILRRPKWTDNGASDIKQWLEVLGLKSLVPCPTSRVSPAALENSLAHMNTRRSVLVQDQNAIDRNSSR
jgi:hypothetical protein